MIDGIIYEYRIADYIWQLRTSFKFDIMDESRNFIRHSKLSDETGITCDRSIIEFEYTDHLSPVPAGAYFKDNCYFAANGLDKVVYRSLSPDGAPAAEVLFRRDGNILYRYLEEYKPTLQYSSCIVKSLSLEYMMLSHSAFLLHSCLVRHAGKAILFTAPSGTGKSTQGDLWVKYRGAEVLNGDRAGIYRKNKEWRATGLPYAGSSGIYLNENAPVRAIVYLAQGPDNKINRLNGAQAFRLLYPQVTIHHWEQDFVAGISDLLITMLQDIPVYYFSCTPDERAVEALEKQLLPE